MRAAGAAGLALLITAMPTAAEERPRFTVQGLLPVQAGQTVDEAGKVLGAPLQPEKPGATAEACHYRHSSAQPGVRHAVLQGRITRSETRDARYTTASGLRVGDTLARAQQVYGARLQTGPHPYFDQGRTLTVSSGDKKHALVMETNNEGRILTLRAGRLPEVMSLEACH